MGNDKPLKIAIVAGEESGDLLGADIVRALERSTGRKVHLVGIGGRHLQELGLKPLFDGAEIALMGFSAVLRDLPRLIRRIGQTAATIAAERPDCLVTIDSPDFSLRVAKKVRAANSAIPIVHYVCPSVWAWRPGRAVVMKPYVDHILCILPECLGLAAGQGGGDEALCRSHPVHPALRGEGACASRRTAGHLCRPPADAGSGRARRRPGAEPAA